LLEHAERCPPDPDVPAAMAADEVIHAEMVRGWPLGAERGEFRASIAAA